MGRIGKAFVLLSLGGFLMSVPGFSQDGGGAIVPVSAIGDGQKLAALDVVDPSGVRFGHVIRVRTGSDGKARRVMVLLAFTEGAGRVAAIRAERLGLDTRRHVLVAQFTRAELLQLAETAASQPNAAQSSDMPMRPLPSPGDDGPNRGEAIRTLRL